MSRLSVLILADAKLSEARRALWQAEESVRHGNRDGAIGETRRAVTHMEWAVKEIRRAFRLNEGD